MSETTEIGIGDTGEFTPIHLGALLLTLSQQGEGLYAGILFRCVRTVSRVIPTAGVMYKGGKFHLIVNPDFMLKQSKFQQLGLLKHEALHLVFSHVNLRRTDDPQLHVIDNYAADCAINSLLNESELPEGGIIPGKASKIPDPEIWDQWTDEQRAGFMKMSQFIERLPKLQSREWYFNAFMENEEIKEQLKTPSLSDVLAQLGFDDHGNWGAGEPGSEEEQAAQAKLKEILARVVNDCNKTGRWGNVSADTQKLIELMLKAQVDWRRQLRNWIGMTRRGNRSTTWKRPNKRLPGLMPQAQRSWVAHIGLFMDESGSVSDAELQEGFAECVNLSRHRSFDLIPFDHEVAESRIQEITKKSKLVVQRVLQGGTSFHAAMAYAKAHRETYDGIIIFTDGEAPDPGPPLRGQRRLWLLSSRGKLMFNAHPGDVVIKLTDKN